MDKIEIPDFEDEEQEKNENSVQESVKYFQSVKKIVEEKNKMKSKPLIPVGVIKPKVPFKKPLQSTNIRKNEPISAYPTDKNTIFVSSRQAKNPMIKYIKNVKLSYKEDMIPDFICARSCCILFISLKYHSLHTDYLRERIKSLGSLFSLRVILCKVDCSDYETSLQSLNELTFLGDCTLVLSWSDQEAAKYVELYKIYENKSATLIQTKIENEYIPRLQDTLTAIRSVNKTDSITLATNFGSLKSIMSASVEELSICPGIGDKKVKRLHDAFNASFKKEKKNSSNKTIKDFITKK
eukprot:gene4280-7616_t